MVARIDMAGSIVGEWTVLSVAPMQGRRSAWNCRCSCGTEAVVLSCHLSRRNSVRCTTCKNKLTAGASNPRWRGGKYVSLSYYNQVRLNAVRRRSGALDFLVSLEYLDALFEQQGGKCAYTGWGLDFYGGEKSRPSRSSASLDRIDSARGYVEGNVQWVHKWANQAKSDLREEEFISMCMAVTKARSDIEGMVLRAAQAGVAVEAGGLPTLEIGAGETEALTEEQR